MLAILPMVLAGLAVAACSMDEVRDTFSLSVHNPTPAAEARTQPAHEPGDDPYNRTVPLP
ncbi:hypothetical protein KXR53_00875 [Inquilinus limosus]|uniref:hypothetical protein n=1 Tax=Inquilinus limosus TaxID=171674 RepID=UPI003F1851D9